MSARRRDAGFTLIEVLVALAVVATALGGTLGVVRQSIATQQHLEQRLFAHWAAQNVLNQFMLEADKIEALTREGEEVVLGRRYVFALSVAPLAPERGEEPSGDYEIAVEVRDTAKRATALARATRQIRVGAGA